MLSSSGTRLAAGSRASRSMLLGRRTARNNLHSTSSKSRITATNVITPMSALYRGRIQALFYSTERVLQLRTGKAKEEQAKTMYNPQRETENCGVGLVASLKSVPSRRVVEQADEMLVRMSHRGGCGCDPASGDGAGESFSVLEYLLSFFFFDILLSN